MKHHPLAHLKPRKLESWLTLGLIAMAVVFLRPDPLRPTNASSQPTKLIEVTEPVSNELSYETLNTSQGLNSRGETSGGEIGDEILRLVSQRDVVIAYSTLAGPVYTLETLTGETIIEPQTLEQLAERHPQFHDRIESTTVRASQDDVAGDAASADDPKEVETVFGWAGVPVDW